jgi:hypothetical protein
VRDRLHDISMFTALPLPRVVVGGMCVRASAVGVSAPSSKMRAEQPDCALGDVLHSRLAVPSLPHAPLWTICHGSEQCSTNTLLRFALLRTCTHCAPCTFVRQLRGHRESLTQRKHTSPKHTPRGLRSALAAQPVRYDRLPWHRRVCCRRRTPGSCSSIGGLNVSTHTERCDMARAAQDMRELTLQMQLRDPCRNCTRHRACGARCSPSHDDTNCNSAAWSDHGHGSRMSGRNSLVASLFRSPQRRTSKPTAFAPALQLRPSAKSL